MKTYVKMNYKRYDCLEDAVEQAEKEELERANLAVYNADNDEYLESQTIAAFDGYTYHAYAIWDYNKSSEGDFYKGQEIWYDSSVAAKEELENAPAGTYTIDIVKQTTSEKFESAEYELVEKERYVLVKANMDPNTYDSYRQEEVIDKFLSSYFDEKDIEFIDTFEDIESARNKLNNYLCDNGEFYFVFEQIYDGKEQEWFFPDLDCYNAPFKYQMSEYRNNVLEKYNGHDEKIDIHFKGIESHAFYNNDTLHHIDLSNLEYIDSHAFTNCKSLETVSISDGSQVEIGTDAFLNCHNLKAVNFDKNEGAGINKLGVHAFHNCTSLKSIDLTNSELVVISNGAFSNCTSLESVTLCEGYVFEYLTRIDAWAFKDCHNLKTINIPDSVTQIHPFAFAGCENLTIKCSADSYAAEYAEQNGIKCEYTDVLDKTNNQNNGRK